MGPWGSDSGTRKPFERALPKGLQEDAVLVYMNDSAAFCKHLLSACYGLSNGDICLQGLQSTQGKSSQNREEDRVRAACTERLRVTGKGVPGNQGSFPEEVTTELCHVGQRETWVQGTALSLLTHQSA